ncbi:MAG: glutamine--fructose-6-phosphate transaminase (isomerizing) [Crocinitomicaceae bacterium]|nr:glutamine--fructose-6-phosphate transaminase (isomerizing) [Crocinitomicaceae bacterium]|tara:strand:+ start:1343 stop:3169 length:1827 start_codon:yes stop_codon:yes gene_type:complete
MCGIVGIVSQRNVVDDLLNGLERLEYRGYDSAGAAIFNGQSTKVLKSVSNVAGLKELVFNTETVGNVGIAHTRWATHGEPSERNAHPHVAGTLSLVHNGIIENHAALREELASKGHVFKSETDSEVIVHLLDEYIKSGLSRIEALKKATKVMHGAYGLVLLDESQPDELLIARSGSPMVIGLGDDAQYVASDQGSLRPYTESFIYLKEGDVAILRENEVQIFDTNGDEVKRDISIAEDDLADDGKGEYDYFMQKEMFEQPSVIGRLVRKHINNSGLIPGSGVEKIAKSLSSVQNIHIVACGTSYHAGLVAKYWIEKYAKIPCAVEIASEYRYRDVAVPDNSAFICVSQSGETADTLAALSKANDANYATTIAICNVQTSSMVRDAKEHLLTLAGAEIGVASTKAFTTQLTAFLLITFALADQNKTLSSAERESFLTALRDIPAQCEQALSLEQDIQEASFVFEHADSGIFLGRGAQSAIALEGALKLKELSYIHAEAYAAGELKHGPLALIDEHLPIVVNAPNDHVVDKLSSNIEEVMARGGRFVIFAAPGLDLPSKNAAIINMPKVSALTSPIVYTLPLQMLSYHVALLKGKNIDRPRNLAKSVSVE